MPAAPAPAEQVRLRVMVGMVVAVQEKGYVATTIADVAKAARISRRTLYEHFADKEACFLAAYSMVSDGLITAVVTAARKVPPGTERTHAAIAEYLNVLATAPDLARAFMVEVVAAGRPGIEARSVVLQRFASMLMDLVAESYDDPRDQLPDGRYAQVFTSDHAVGLVGALDELVVQTIVTGPDDTLDVRLRRLVQPANEIAARLLMRDTPMP